jgi:serine/threonine-protein kinase
MTGQMGDFEFGHFHRVGRIGAGSQGAVDLYQHNTNSDLIAVKNVSTLDGAINARFFQAIESLMRSRQARIVPLLGYDLQIDSNILRIAMAYVGPYSLKSVLESPQNYPWFTLTGKTIIIVDIAIAMCWIHFCGIIHRDLKPANILLDPVSHYPKIADFGLSREANVDTTVREGTSTRLSLAPGMDKTMAMTGGVGSPLYMAPEVIEGRGYSSRADVFSFGVLLYEIVTGEQPCQGCGDTSVFHFYEKVASGARETIPDTVEPFTAGLISRCWDDDPHNRPTFLEIMDDLGQNHCKIFIAVDRDKPFLQSLMILLMLFGKCP